MARSSSAQEHKSTVKQSRETFSDRFRRLADKVTEGAGTAWAMGAAALVVLAWLVTGPIFGFSDTWQLVINTGTTIITFLMVFAIQTSQNRESKAMHLKLDELIRATKGARNAFIDEEYETAAELKLDEARLRERARRRPR
jgi:low affinity Fe/Cu permease